MHTKQLLNSHLIVACRTARPSAALHVHRALRKSSTITTQQDASRSHDTRATKAIPTGLGRLPTMSLVRNLLLGVFFTSPVLFKLGLGMLQTVAESRSVMLNPDRNPVLRALFKPFVYDQFCAGTNKSEIYHTRDSIKSMGYSGIVLCYGKEIQISQSNELRSTGEMKADEAAEIEMWRAGNIATLDMVGRGDWLGIK